jgi:GNAT superfamily N-acetyltransferase
MGPASVRIERADPEDLAGILGVQHRAFTRVARDYDLPPSDFPPTRESLGDLAAMLADGTLFWKALDDSDRIIGSVRATLREGGVVEVGRLVVDDGSEGQGVGTALMGALEASFPGAERFDLFTGKEARRPLELYSRLGYRIYRTETVGPGIELVWMEKRASGG